jgi:two-component system KDP operon response regulator KdpE
MDEKSVLVIEDDKYISHFMDISLTQEGYHVLIGQSAAEGMFLLRSNNPDIVLLDLGLPDRDGMEVLRELRTFSEVPVLIVSARGMEEEKVQALDAGANDYITKPFGMGELMARIRVVERMMHRGIAEDGSIFQDEWLKVDTDRRLVTVDDREVHLTPIEYKTLILLIENRGKVLTYNFIIRQIWGYEGADNKTVRVFMANLRRKIEKDSTNPKLIRTEVGVGYRFC